MIPHIMWSVDEMCHIWAERSTTWDGEPLFSLRALLCVNESNTAEATLFSEQWSFTCWLWHCVWNHIFSVSYLGLRAVKGPNASFMLLLIQGATTPLRGARSRCDSWQQNPKRAFEYEEQDFTVDACVCSRENRLIIGWTGTMSCAVWAK